MSSPTLSLSLTIFISALLLLFPNPTFSTEYSPISSPSPSPSPSPQLPPATAPYPAFLRSPPAPPPSVPAPDSPSPSEHQESPPPADGVHVADLDREDGSGGMSGGKKTGIAFGVIAGCCVLAAAAILYKKRQNNIRRGHYSYTARGDYP